MFDIYEKYREKIKEIASKERNPPNDFSKLNNALVYLAEQPAEVLKILREYVDELIRYKESVKDLEYFCPKCQYSTPLETNLVASDEVCVFCSSKMILRKRKKA